MTKIINWMGGWPREGLIPASEWEERLAKAADCGAGASGLAMSQQQVDRLQSVILDWLWRSKPQRSSASLIMARGADAVLQRLIRQSLTAGDVVLVDRLTSRSALQIFRKARLQIGAVAGDMHGMDPDALRAAIARYKPRLVYTAPACSDPEGRAWPRQRAQAITAACLDAGVLMLRDDRQEPLVYDDAVHGYSANSLIEPGVVSLGQLPPGLVAGMKFGWALGPAKTLGRWFPEPDDLVDTGSLVLSPLELQALSELLADQPLAEQAAMIRIRCRARMEQITGLLSQQPLSGLHWRKPDGGMHLWLTLPEGLEGEALLRGAWLRGLMFQPGSPFYAVDPKPNTIRLTFADTDERQMKQGVQRLFDTVQDFLGRSAPD